MWGFSFSCDEPPVDGPFTSITLFNYSSNSYGILTFAEKLQHQFSLIILAGESKVLYGNWGEFSPISLYDSILVYDTLYIQKKFEIPLDDVKWEVCGYKYKYFIHDYLITD